jgi:phage terminase large subunit-like protein
LNGKSPFLAAICCTELLGPVRFAYWGKDGQPVGKPVPSPLIQLVAVSEAQTENTMGLIREMLLLGSASSKYFVDVGQTRILSRHGRIEPVTANAKSREGQRVSFAVFDETHLWDNSNGGIRLANTVRRNLGKMKGRSIETSNAYAPGEGSVAESSHQYYINITAGLITGQPGFLFDTAEAPAGTPYKGEGRRAGLIQAYGDSCSENGGWIDLDRIEQEMDDPATTEPDGRRFYFNQVVQGYSQWINPDRWNELKSDEYIPKGERIALGFDGSIRNDSTALVACRLSDGFIWPIRVWEKPDDVEDWEVPFLEVDSVVRETLTNYRVSWVYADPAYWQDIVGRWALDYPDIVYEFWTHRRGAMARAIERFESAVNLGNIRWSSSDEHEVLSRHVMNAHADDTPAGKLIRKEFPQSRRKIDAAMAAVLAFEARGAAITDGRLDVDDSESTLYSF